MAIDSNESEVDTREDELSEEELAESKQRSRLNGIILVAIFLLTALAPFPYKTFVPLLLVVPMLYSIYVRIRRRANKLGRTQISESPTQVPSTSREDPYSYTPSDPKDPRRYRPIG